MKKLLVAAITLISLDIYASKLNFEDIEYDSDSGQLSYYSSAGEKKIVENVQIPIDRDGKSLIAQSKMPSVDDQASYLLIFAVPETHYCPAGDNYWLLEKNSPTKNWSKLLSGKACGGDYFNNHKFAEKISFIVSKKLGLLYLKTSSNFGRFGEDRFDLLNRVGLEYLKDDGNLDALLDQTIGRWARYMENEAKQSSSAQAMSLENFLETNLQPEYLEVLKLKQVDKYWNYTADEKEQALIMLSIKGTCEARIKDSAARSLLKNVKFKPKDSDKPDIDQIDLAYKSSSNYKADVSINIRDEESDVFDVVHRFTVNFTKNDCKITKTIYLGED